MGYWGLDDANAAIPRVRRFLADARTLLYTARQEARGLGDGGSQAAGARVTPAAHALQELVDDLARQGIVLRDVDRGLLDFRAVTTDGREYLLCWLDGEAAVEWWHWPDTGFAGRTPLSDAPG